MYDGREIVVKGKEASFISKRLLVNDNEEVKQCQIPFFIEKFYKDETVSDAVYICISSIAQWTPVR